MATEETVVTSPLDKPLQFLTEEDISQLTREDCRKYLKDKGMRRPSWNKSQAIQQVISLKRLLETTPDSCRKKLCTPPPRAPKPVRGDAPVSVPAEEPVPYQRKELDGSGDLSSHVVVGGNDSVPPRTVAVISGPLGQLTIFYGGKVNVYDDVPVEQAQTIMEFAASPRELPVEVSSDVYAARQSLGSHLPSSNNQDIPESPSAVLPTAQAVNMSESSRLHREDSGTLRDERPVLAGDGMCSRKASVQRYLEKRKDRFKSKTKATTQTNSSLDIYANHSLGNQSLDELSNRSDTCSSPQIRPPNTPSRCSQLSG